jgi:hypothetical protein
MSLELTQLYKNLSQRQKDELVLGFKNAPKMLLLLDLLQNSAFLNTKKAIDIIYQQEIQEKVSREVLSNRFYKLWEKLKTVILEDAKQSPFFICEEDKQLNHARFLISKKQFALAIEYLIPLEKSCWEKNYFEFLPSIYDSFMNAIVGIEPVNTSQLKTYFELKQKAIELKNSLDEVTALHYETFLDIANFELVTKKIRAITKKYNYPRFEFIYYYLNLGYGVFLGFSKQTANPNIAKNFQKFKAIKQAYPNLPLFKIFAHYRTKLEIKISVLEIGYWYVQQKTNRVAKLLTDFTKQADLIYFLPEASIRNLLTISIYNNNPTEALFFINLLKSFQEAQYDKDSDMPFYAYELLFFIKQYPKHKPSNPKLWICELDKKIAQNPNLLDWVYIDVIIFSILYDEFDLAKKYLEAPKMLKYFERVKFPFSATELLEAAQQKDKNRLLEFENKLQNILQKGDLERAILEYCKDLAEVTRVVLERI